MKAKFLPLLLLAVLVSGCSLAEDVTPPPALATAQAAPVESDSAPQRPATSVSSSAGGLPTNAPSLISGAQIYIEDCEPCHGASGMGDGSMSANLDVPIPALGDLALAGEARPLDWYTVVTEGRIDKFMPPFASLNDAQRWDVVAYALSLSYPDETRQTGEELYLVNCAACHGDSGQGAADGPPLNSGESFATHSLEDIETLIERGEGSMPGFAETIPQPDRTLLAAYTQSLGTLVHGAMAADPMSEALPAGSLRGRIRGVVVMGTEGGTLPEDLEVTLVGIDSNVPVLEENFPVEADGSFSVDDLELQPGRIYGVLVEYQGVIYYSVGGHLLESAPELDLPLVIYETTPDESDLSIDRLHLIFDFSIEGIVEVSELLLFSTDNDRTVVQESGINALTIELPEGFSNLRFPDAVAPDQYTPTAEGFVIHEPVRPGEPLEVVVVYAMPYERSLDFSQPIGYPVQAVVILAQSGGLTIEGEGIQDLGARDMGGMVLDNYAMASLKPGDALRLSLRGNHPLGGSAASNTNLAIGVGIFGIVLVGIGLGWWAWRKRVDDEQPLERQGNGENLNRIDMLRAIAALDDAYEAGELDQGEYEQQRTILKNKLVERADD